MKQKNRLSWLILTIGIPALFILAVTQVYAAVELIYFRASGNGNQILLEWETGSELDNSGFLVMRNTTGSLNPDNYTVIPVVRVSDSETVTFIQAEGDSSIGALYRFYDPNVTVGQRYFYFLQDISTDNEINHHGPINAVGGQTSTPTTAPKTHTPTPTKTATSAVSTATRTRTATSASSSNSTATRTRTPASNNNTSQPSRTTAATSTTTATLDPNVTPSDTPTPTITFTPLPPLHQTATALVAQVTPLVSITPTLDYHVSFEGTPPTPSPSPTATATEPGSDTVRPLDDEFQSGVLKVLGGVLLTGGILTGGIFFFLARKKDDDDETLS